MTDRPLWTVEAMAAAMGADAGGSAAAVHSGHFHRYAHPRARRSVLRDQGRQPRRPRFRGGCACGRRRPCGGRGRPARPFCRPTPRCSSFPTCSTGCANWRGRRGRARRRKSSRSPAPSARPAPRRRCAWRSLRDGETHASVASYNNHWGVPLSLARCPATRALRRVRDRHEPCRRDRAADAPGAAACGDHHHRRAGASRILPLGRGDRRRQGRNLSRARAGRSGGDQSRQSAVRASRARRAERRGRAHRRRSASTRTRTRG